MAKKFKRRRQVKKQKEERLEALMRIPVLIITGIILVAWRIFVYILVLVNLIYTLVVGKRLKEVAELSEIWNTQWYVFQRYMIFVSNKRPFPFGKLEEKMSNFNHVYSSD